MAQATPILYPNPVSGGTSTTLRLTLRVSSNVRVQIYTLAFRKVYDHTFAALSAGSQNLTIPLADSEGNPLANGLYYVIVTVNGQRTVLKLVVTR